MQVYLIYKVPDLYNDKTIITYNSDDYSDAVFQFKKLTIESFIEKINKDQIYTKTDLPYVLRSWNQRQTPGTFNSEFQYKPISFRNEYSLEDFTISGNDSPLSDQNRQCLLNLIDQLNKEAETYIENNINTKVGDVNKLIVISEHDENQSISK